MIVVDASVLVAIGDGEPDALEYVRVLAVNDAVIASINYVEAGIILISRRRMIAKSNFDRWLSELKVEVHRNDDLSSGALQAYLTYGRGFHRAKLNLADCFAYALAIRLNAALLYKGDDFALTDVRRALQPT